MRKIELLINKISVDFNEIDKLPLSLKIEADKFFKIGSAGGVGLDNALRRLVLPISKKLIQAISGNPTLPIDSVLETEFDAVLLVNGIPVFSGSARLKTANVFTHSDMKSSFELLGDGKKFWNIIESINLHDLDLGTQLWTMEEVTNSFNSVYDENGYQGLFAPVVYGGICGTIKRNVTAITYDDDGNATGTENKVIRVAGAWANRDFRFHVYYPAILKEICRMAGYNLQSSLLNEKIFNESVHLYHGNTFPAKFLIPPTYVGFNAAITDDVPVDYTEIEPVFLKFDEFNTSGIVPSATLLDDQYIIIQEKGLYNFHLQASAFSGGPPAQDVLIRFYVYVNGEVQDENIYYKNPDIPNNNGTEFYDNEFQLNLSNQDFVTIRVKGGGSISTFSLTAESAELNPNESVFYVSSCLADKPAKDFLRGISHQFMGAWEINDIRKTVVFEPRFKYAVHSLSRPTQGFYFTENHTATFSTSVKNVKADISTLQKEYTQHFGSSVQLYYELASQYAKEKYPTDGTLNPYGIRYFFRNKNLPETKSPNPYFSFLPQGGFRKILGRNLPALISSYNSEDGIGEPNAAKYDNFISCGLVYRNNASIRLDDSDEYTNAPLISQFIESEIINDTFIQKNYSVSYGNHLGESDKYIGNVPHQFKGLGHIFYSDYFATIRRGVIISGKLNLSFWKISNFSFRFLRTMNITNFHGFWIITKLQKFKPTRFLLTEFQAIKKFNTTIFDKLFEERAWNLPAFPNNDNKCDYTVNTEHDDAGTSSEISAIKLLNEYDLPLQYPYQSAVTNDVNRLKLDLEYFLNMTNVEFNSVNVTVNSYIWNIEIIETTLQFRRVIFSLNGGAFTNNNTFTILNCG